MVNTSQQERELNGGYNYTTDYQPRGSVTADAPKAFKLDDEGHISLNVLGRISVIGAAVGTSALLLSGCSSPSQVEETPRSWQTEEATPTPTETAPALITNLDAMGWEQFVNADSTDIQSYGMYTILNNKEKHTATLADDDRKKWTTPSIDMDGQAILDNFYYTGDEAHITVKLDVDTGKWVLDQNKAIKVLSSAYYTTNSSDTLTASFTSARDDILAHDNPYVQGEAKDVVTSTSELQQGTDANGQPIQYKMVEYTTSSGENLVAKFVYVEFPSAEDETATQSNWVLASLDTAPIQ